MSFVRIATQTRGNNFQQSHTHSLPHNLQLHVFSEWSNSVKMEPKYVNYESDEK